MEQWKNLESTDQIESLIENSKKNPVVIFKHSTRCSISGMAMNKLQREWKDEEMKEIDFYYLDLLSYRNVSNKIASDLQIEHQSPQLIILKDGNVTYHTSHMGVSYRELKNNLQNLNSTS